ISLGRVYEFMGSYSDAVFCYRSAALAGEGSDEALKRLVLISTQTPIPFAETLLPELERASAKGFPLADWARARVLLSRADDDNAYGLLNRFLKAANRTDPAWTHARAELTRIRAKRENQLRLRATRSLKTK